MSTKNSSQNNLLPVTCPVCGENQNIMVGGFDEDGLPVGEVNCMACRHLFKRDEYLHGLKMRRKEINLLTGPLPK